MKSHGLEFGKIPNAYQSVFTSLAGGSSCEAVEVKHGILATLGTGESFATHHLRVNNPDLTNDLAVLIIFSQPITPAEVTVKRTAQVS